MLLRTDWGSSNTGILRAACWEHTLRAPGWPSDQQVGAWRECEEGEWGPDTLLGDAKSKGQDPWQELWGVEVWRASWEDSESVRASAGGQGWESQSWGGGGVLGT